MGDESTDGFNAAKYFFRNYEITLDSGRTIWLANLNQYQTYAGALEGVPWGRWRMGRAEWFRREAEESFDCRTIIVDEREIPLPVPEEELDEYRWPMGKDHPHSREFEPVSLGPITCEARFMSLEPVRGEQAKDFSMLCMIWFQQGFAMPIDPLVLARIRALDWEQLAENGEL